jgi:polyisoprenoid-binding protein YceI
VAPSRAGRPPRLSVTLWVLAGLGAVVLAGWWFVLRSDAPERAALPERPTGVSLPSATGAAGDAGATPDGTWRVRRGPEVFVGYRATERWGADTVSKEAVGRTGAVDGTVRLSGAAIESAELTADMGELRSDQSARDAILRGRWLDSDAYPEARFRLLGPVALPGPPALGEVVEVTVPGSLTVAGSTQPVEVPLLVRWNGTTVDVAGGVRISLPAFGIEPPETPFIAVDDTVEIELQLTLGKG